MTEPTNEELDAVIKDCRTRIYPQDMHPRFERAIMRDAIAKWGTPQPTHAQAVAVPTREFLERTLAAMEGVIDVADRKTDEFDALRSCVIDLTLMLFSDAKRHAKEADHEL